MNNTTLDDEWNFLLHCCQTRFNTNLPNNNNINLKKIDWQRVFQIARRQAILPLFLDYIQNKPLKEDIPEDIIQKSKLQQFSIATRNLQSTQELLQLIQLLRSAEVEIIPYKGSLLAMQAYGNISQRTFSDIDFLFKRTDLPKIENALNKRGYESELDISSLRKRVHFWQHCEYNFDLYENDKRLFHVEPHWRLGVKRFQVHLGFADIVPFTNRKFFHGVPVNVLTPEGLLITTILHHSARDRWQRLKYVCDVAAIMQRYHQEIDWNVLLKEVERLKIKNLLLCGIGLTQTILKVNVPLVLVDLINKPKLQKHINRLANEMFAEKFFKASFGQTYLRGLLFHLKIRDHWMTKSKVLFYHLIRFVTPKLKYRLK